MPQENQELISQLCDAVLQSIINQIEAKLTLRGIDEFDLEALKTVLEAHHHQATPLTAAQIKDLFTAASSALNEVIDPFLAPGQNDQLNDVIAEIKANFNFRKLLEPVPARHAMQEVSFANIARLLAFPDDSAISRSLKRRPQLARYFDELTSNRLGYKSLLEQRSQVDLYGSLAHYPRLKWLFDNFCRLPFLALDNAEALVAINPLAPESKKRVAAMLFSSDVFVERLLAALDIPVNSRLAELLFSLGLPEPLNLDDAAVRAKLMARYNTLLELSGLFVGSDDAGITVKNNPELLTALQLLLADQFITRDEFVANIQAEDRLRLRNEMLVDIFNASRANAIEYADDLIENPVVPLDIIPHHQSGDVTARHAAAVALANAIPGDGSVGNVLSGLKELLRELNEHLGYVIESGEIAEEAEITFNKFIVDGNITSYPVSIQRALYSQWQIGLLQAFLEHYVAGPDQTTVALLDIFKGKLQTVIAKNVFEMPGAVDTQKLINAVLEVLEPAILRDVSYAELEQKLSILVEQDDPALGGASSSLRRVYSILHFRELKGQLLNDAALNAVYPVADLLADMEQAIVTGGVVMKCEGSVGQPNGNLLKPAIDRGRSALATDDTLTNGVGHLQLLRAKLLPGVPPAVSQDDLTRAHLLESLFLEGSSLGSLGDKLHAKSIAHYIKRKLDEKGCDDAVKVFVNGLFDPAVPGTYKVPHKTLKQYYDFIEPLLAPEVPHNIAIAAFRNLGISEEDQQNALFARMPNRQVTNSDTDQLRALYGRKASFFTIAGLDKQHILIQAIASNKIMCRYVLQQFYPGGSGDLDTVKADAMFDKETVDFLKKLEKADHGIEYAELRENLQRLCGIDPAVPLTPEQTTAFEAVAKDLYAKRQTLVLRNETNAEVLRSYHGQLQEAIRLYAASPQAPEADELVNVINTAITNSVIDDGSSLDGITEALNALPDDAPAGILKATLVKHVYAQAQLQGLSKVEPNYEKSYDYDRIIAGLETAHHVGTVADRMSAIEREINHLANTPDRLTQALEKLGLADAAIQKHRKFFTLRKSLATFADNNSGVEPANNQLGKANVARTKAIFELVGLGDRYPDYADRLAQGDKAARDVRYVLHNSTSFTELSDTFSKLNLLDALENPDRALASLIQINSNGVQLRQINSAVFAAFLRSMPQLVISQALIIQLNDVLASEGVFNATKFTRMLGLVAGASEDNFKIISESLTEPGKMRALGLDYFQPMLAEQRFLYCTCAAVADDPDYKVWPATRVLLQAWLPELDKDFSAEELTALNYYFIDYLKTESLEFKDEYNRDDFGEELYLRFSNFIKARPKSQLLALQRDAINASTAYGDHNNSLGATLEHLHATADHQETALNVEQLTRQFTQDYNFLTRDRKRLLSESTDEADLFTTVNWYRAVAESAHIFAAQSPRRYQMHRDRFAAIYDALMDTNSNVIRAERRIRNAKAALEQLNVDGLFEHFVAALGYDYKKVNNNYQLRHQLTAQQVAFKKKYKNIVELSEQLKEQAKEYNKMTKLLVETEDLFERAMLKLPRDRAAKDLLGPNLEVAKGAKVTDEDDDLHFASGDKPTVFEIVPDADADADSDDDEVRPAEVMGGLDEPAGIEHATAKAEKSLPKLKTSLYGSYIDALAINEKRTFRSHHKVREATAAGVLQSDRSVDFVQQRLDRTRNQYALSQRSAIECLRHAETRDENGQMQGREDQIQLAFLRAAAQILRNEPLDSRNRQPAKCLRIMDTPNAQAWYDAFIALGVDKEKLITPYQSPHFSAKRSAWKEYRKVAASNPAEGLWDPNTISGSMSHFILQDQGVVTDDGSRLLFLRRDENTKKFSLGKRKADEVFHSITKRHTLETSAQDELKQQLEFVFNTLPNMRFMDNLDMERQQPKEGIRLENDVDTSKLYLALRALGIASDKIILPDNMPKLSKEDQRRYFSDESIKAARELAVQFGWYDNKTPPGSMSLTLLNKIMHPQAEFIRRLRLWHERLKANVELDGDGKQPNEPVRVHNESVSEMIEDYRALRALGVADDNITFPDGALDDISDDLRYQMSDERLDDAREVAIAQRLFASDTPEDSLSDSIIQAINARGVRPHT